MLLSKDCLVTLRNEIHLRCDGSEVAAQLALIKRGCLVTSLGLSATKPVVKPPFPKSWSCCDGLLLTTGGKTALYSVQTGRPGILPPLWGARFHPQTASFHRRNDWLESGSVLGSWQDTDSRKQLVITLASQSLSQVQMLHLFVPLLPYHPHLLFTYNDAFLLSLSWEKDIRAAWTHPEHCWWKFRKRPWTHLRMSRVKIRAGGGGKRGSYFSSVPISKNIGRVDLTNRTPQMQ